MSSEAHAAGTNALDALETASGIGEFYYHVQRTAFGPYVDQVGRNPASGQTGWVFKVNGQSPPVGADAVSPLRQLLVAGQEAGEFGSFDPEVMALAIRAIVDAASFYFTAHPDLDIDHYIAEAVQLFDRATARM